LEPLFTPEEDSEYNPWLVPMQLPEVDESQLALWSAEDVEQPAP